MDFYESATVYSDFDPTDLASNISSDTESCAPSTQQGNSSSSAVTVPRSQTKRKKRSWIWDHCSLVEAKDCGSAKLTAITASRNLAVPRHHRLLRTWRKNTDEPRLTLMASRNLMLWMFSCRRVPCRNDTAHSHSVMPLLIPLLTRTVPF